MGSPFIEPLPAGIDIPIAERAIALPAFLSGASSSRPLAVLRIGLTAVLLAQAFALAPYLFLFLGEHGIVHAPITNTLVSASLPRGTFLVTLLPTYIHD